MRVSFQTKEIADEVERHIVPFVTKTMKQVLGLTSEGYVVVGDQRLRDNSKVAICFTTFVLLQLLYDDEAEALTKYFLSQ